MITTQHLITLLPILILGMTVIAVMLSIALRRNNKTSAIITAIGMLIALMSVAYSAKVVPISVTEMMKLDNFTLFYTVLVIIIGLITTLFAYCWLENYPDNRDEFYLLLLISVLGGCVLSSANHLATLFIGIELLSLPMFGLIGYAYQEKNSLEAAIKYMVLSAVASSFLLFGIALLYAGTGTLSFDTLGAYLSTLAVPEPLILLGFGMLIVGLGFKLSLFPFQLWTPDVYQGAPTMVSFFLATAGKIAVFCVAVRLFTVMPVIDASDFRWILTFIALCSIFFGNFLAILQRNIKRLLAYSSISHIGYMLIILLALSMQDDAIEATNFYFVSYLLGNIGTFGVLAILSSPYHGVEEDTSNILKGLFWKSPILALSMAISLISLAGIPLTIGFLGKFYLLILAVNTGLWWLIAAIIIGSALGLYYYLRVAINLFLEPTVSQIYVNQKAVLISRIVVVFAAMLIFILGVYPQYLIDLSAWAQLG